MGQKLKVEVKISPEPQKARSGVCGQVLGL